MLALRVLLGLAAVLRAAFVPGEALPLTTTPVVSSARVVRRPRHARSAVPLAPG